MSKEEAGGEEKPEPRKVIHVESPKPEPMSPEDIPGQFTDEWLNSLRPGQLAWLERRRKSLSESQQESLSAYEAATIGETVSRIQQTFAETYGSLTAKLADALSRPPSPVADAFNRQEQATKRLLESVRPIDVPTPDLGDLDEVFAAKAKRRAERDRREKALVELTATVADSTRVLAQDVRGQQWLTWLLAVAVLFDIINGIFENPSGRSAAFSLFVAIAIVLACAEAGRWVNGRRKK